MGDRRESRGSSFKAARALKDAGKESQLFEMLRGIVWRWISGKLTFRPVNVGFLGNFEFHGLPAGAFMRAVAERRVAGVATRAPPVDAGFYFISGGLGSHAVVSRISAGEGSRLSRRLHVSGGKDGSLLRFFHGGGGDLFIQLRIPLGGNFVDIRCYEPACEDDG